MNPTQRTRRILVVASVLLYVLIFIPSLTSFAFIGAVVVAQIALFAYAGHVGRHTAVAADETLDERQRAIKQQVFQRSYHVIMGLAVFLLVMGGLMRVDWWVVIAFLVLVLTLPTYMLLWLEPDPPEDETIPSMKQAA